MACKQNEIMNLRTILLVKLSKLVSLHGMNSYEGTTGDIMHVH